MLTYEHKESMMAVVNELFSNKYTSTNGFT